MTDAWIDTLRRECDQTSQAKVSARLRQTDGFPSSSVINQVLHNKYPGRTDRLKAIVEGVYLHTIVNCPVLDEITTDQCADHQSRPFANTNPTRIRLWQACRSGCPHSKLEQNHD